MTNKLKTAHLPDSMDVLDGKHNFLSELFLIKFHLKCNRKGGKFLKKLWCCISGRVIAANLMLTPELKHKLTTIKSKKVDISSISPSSIALTKG